MEKEIEKEAEQYKNAQFIDFGDLNESAERRIKDAFKAGAKYALENQWVSVETRLPECWSQHRLSFGSGYVLTIDKGREMQINQYWKKTDASTMRVIEQGWENDNDIITHWRPLPPNPKP